MASVSVQSLAYGIYLYIHDVLLLCPYTIFHRESHMFSMGQMAETSR